MEGVVQGSPAAAVGLRPGDVLVAAGGEEIRRLADLSRVLKQTNPGKPLTLRVQRDGEVLEVEAVLAEP